MADWGVENVKLGSTDRSGYEIKCIFALNPPEYAVYGTDVRVALQYADDRDAARQQRTAMAACNPLRGQINGLIDGWRGVGRGSRPHRVIDYDRRVADALVVGLEGSVANAVDLLAEIRNDIVSERRSLAQSDYLLTAVITVLVLLVIAAAVRALPIFPDGAEAVASAAMTGSAGGTLGAFFSIAVGLRGRTVLVDLQKWDNRRDAILRVVVGTIGGAILICLFLTGLVSALKIESATLTAPAGVGTLTALVIGFLAGFSERAVPDILSKASLATDAATGEGSTDVATDHARAVASSADTPPAVTPPAAASADAAAADSVPANGPDASGGGTLPQAEEDLPQADEEAPPTDDQQAMEPDVVPGSEEDLSAGGGDEAAAPSEEPAGASGLPAGPSGEDGLDPELSGRAPQR
ncbi:MAG TPA: hypothetical protein VF702_07865 [Allosphingosinicella sp.]|jgi:hypothetical protein